MNTENAQCVAQRSEHRLQRGDNAGLAIRELGQYTERLPAVDYTRGVPRGQHHVLGIQLACGHVDAITAN